MERENQHLGLNGTEKGQPIKGFKKWGDVFRSGSFQKHLQKTEYEGPLSLSFRPISRVSVDF